MYVQNFSLWVHSWELYPAQARLINVIGLCVEFSRLLETEFAGLTFSNTIGNRNDHSKHKS